MRYLSIIHHSASAGVMGLLHPVSIWGASRRCAVSIKLVVLSVFSLFPSIRRFFLASHQARACQSSWAMAAGVVLVGARQDISAIPEWTNGVMPQVFINEGSLHQPSPLSVCEGLVGALLLHVTKWIATLCFVADEYWRVLDSTLVPCNASPEIDGECYEIRTQVHTIDNGCSLLIRGALARVARRLAEGRRSYSTWRCAGQVRFG